MLGWMGQRLQEFTFYPTMRPAAILKCAVFILVAAAFGFCSGKSSLGGDGEEDAVRPDAAEMDGAEDAAYDGPEICRPMDARAEGDCYEELPGFFWNGRHCVSLYHGCACVGSDCESLYETATECVEDRRACYDVSCRRQDVRIDLCTIECVIMDSGVFWNGRECVGTGFCSCDGEDCQEKYASVEECEAVHADCDATLCRETLAVWFPEEAGLCGFTCGAENPLACEAPVGSCRCMPGRTFLSGTGCMDDPACTQKDLCLATLGKWHEAEECRCFFFCGDEADCDDCPGAGVCECGPHKSFSPDQGCYWDEGCAPATDQDLCLFTGGRWDESAQGCGHLQCGVPDTVAECRTPGCDCGRLKNFLPERGCYYVNDCLYRGYQESCWGWGYDSNCRTGLYCCAHCAGPGCMYCDSAYSMLWEFDDCLDDGCPTPP